jgi:hypothetical protein
MSGMLLGIEAPRFDSAARHDARGNPGLRLDEQGFGEACRLLQMAHRMGDASTWNHSAFNSRHVRFPYLRTKNAIPPVLRRNKPSGHVAVNAKIEPESSAKCGSWIFGSGRRLRL